MPALPHILIIEDDPNLRRTLALILQQAGYRVMTAGQVQEALSSLYAQTCDLIVLNSDQAELTDMELLNVLGQARSTVSVLLLTASSAMTAQSLAEPIGRRAYLAKPIDPARILACVRDILDQAGLPAG